MKNAGLILGMVLVAVVFAMAQDATPRADGREERQRARIHSGRRNGEITRREAAVLNREQRHIRRTERRLKADGPVTVQEKRRIEKKQDRASRHIRRAKSNPISNN